MPTIYDLVQSKEVVAYWETMANQRRPYLGDTLFPAQKKMGLDLKWIKGNKGLPVVLNVSAFDAKAVPRDRIGFDRVSASMPFFKESLLIDEELRQQLNIVLDTGNQAYIDSVINRVFDDQTSLLDGAAAQRERMRMQLLSSGMISLSANGQTYTYDYGIKSTHKPTAGASWATETTDIIGDIRTWQDLIEDETGVRPTRAICSRKTWSYMLKNTVISKSIFVLSSGQAAVSDRYLRNYLMEELGLTVEVYTKKYINESGASAAFIPDDVFILIPEGTLGSTWFGTTPEESDLLGSGVENVAITDTGVAVTTIKIADPVNVETKVTQICLPSFEAADQIIIADIEP